MNEYPDLFERLISEFMALGYPRNSMITNFKTLYGKIIDLVVYESNKPKIVLEVKHDFRFPSREEQYSFHPVIRQAQSLAQEINAPFFAVSDGLIIKWFDIDNENGRPRLLDNPVLPAKGEKEIYSEETKKELILQLLFRLHDLGKGRFDVQAQLIQVGLSLLARLRTEAGDDQLERSLQTPNFSLHWFDNNLSDLLGSDDESYRYFFSEAFYYLDAIKLSDIPEFVFLDSLDNYFDSIVVGKQLWTFKLPFWISEFLARLTNQDLDGELLDIYSNFGDGVTAIAKFQGRSNRVLSIAPDGLSYLWDLLKRSILGLNTNNVNRINSLQGYIDQTEECFEKFSNILVAPPFGKRVYIHKIHEKFSNRRVRSEDLFVDVALDWVKPGGRVIVIVPENLLFSHSQKKVREIIWEKSWIRSVIGLEQFMPNSGVKTSILVIDKKSKNNQQSEILMSRILREDIKDIIKSRKSIFSNEKINEIIKAFSNNSNGKYSPEKKGFWFVPSENLSLESWSVGNYDPELNFEITSQFPLIPLQELATIKRGSPLTLDKKGGNLQVIGPGSVRAFIIDPTKLDRTSKDRLTSNPMVARTNDVLIHAVGTYRGQAALVDSEFGGLNISRNIIVVRVDSSQILPAYIVAVLNSSFVKNQLKDRTTGSVIKILSLKKIRDVLIPVPDIGTQRKIINDIDIIRNELLKIEQQALIIQSKLKEQEKKFDDFLNNIHLGGNENE